MYCYPASQVTCLEAGKAFGAAILYTSLNSTCLQAAVFIDPPILEIDTVPVLSSKTCTHRND